MDVECLSCGKKSSTTPKALLRKKFLCTCVNPRDCSSVSSKESKRLSYLYSKAFLNFHQLSILTGYSTALLRAVANRDSWVEEESNVFKTNRYARRQRFIHREYEIHKKAYNRQARKITQMVYNRYKSIIDPKGLRGPEFSLDHMLSIHQAYALGPADLRFVCHPANLQILDARSNLEKRTSSVGVDTLKSRIRDFEKKHGKVKFSSEYKYRFKEDAEELKPEEGLRVLGFDPGTSNFGCFAGLITGTDDIQYFESLESAMLVNPLCDMPTAVKDVPRFLGEIRSYIDTYRPHAIVIERFMTRGIKGPTIELVNMMIGALVTLVDTYREEGKHIYIKIVTAASWKNQVNRIFPLESIYKACKKRGLADHQVDAALMSMYAYPSKGNPYAFLSNRDSRISFVKSLVAST